MVLHRSDLSILQGVELVMRTEVAESVSHMAQAAYSPDHVRKPFIASNRLLTPMVSDQHSEGVSSQYSTCLSHQQTLEGLANK